jgi:hypothetical protein
VIQLSLSLEQVGLIITTKLAFFEQFVLISNQNTIESFKGVFLTIFLVLFPVGVEIRHEHVKWCSQVHQD